MKNWRELLVLPTTPIIETMHIINDTAKQFVVVVDHQNRLLGTVTDGDIRRAILRGETLESPIQQVMNNNPLIEYIGKSDDDYKNILKKKKIKQLPILDSNDRIINVIFIDENLTEKKYSNIAVLMVGGLGTRLRPLTESIPKPMLNIGNKPILETIIENFKHFGFTNFVLSVNYKKKMIMDYFQDGTHLGVNIEYIEETKRLGTAGALSLLLEKPTESFFVMNGDLLTKINFEQLLDFHNETDSTATMCVREYEYQIPYGVIETKDHQLLSIVEKPVHKSFVNAGIYVLNPIALEHVPNGEFYDMPELYKKLMHEQEKVSAFPLREYWLDIGRLDDYEKANGDYKETFNDWR